MIIGRDFDVYLDDEVIDRVSFIGQEYTADAVRLWLIEHDRADPHIAVKQVGEVKA